MNAYMFRSNTEATTKTLKTVCHSPILLCQYNMLLYSVHHHGGRKLMLPDRYNTAVTFSITITQESNPTPNPWCMYTILASG
jgi:hypothetical protein